MKIAPESDIPRVKDEVVLKGLESAEAALKNNSDTTQTKSLLAELARCRVSLVNGFTWYTKQELADLAIALSKRNRVAHENFVAKVVSIDPSLRSVVKP